MVCQNFDTPSFLFKETFLQKSPHGCDAMRAEVLCSYFKNLRYYSTKCQ